MRCYTAVKVFKLYLMTIGTTLSIDSCINVCSTMECKLRLY